MTLPSPTTPSSPNTVSLELPSGLSTLSPRLLTEESLLSSVRLRPPPTPSPPRSRPDLFSFSRRCSFEPYCRNQVRLPSSLRSLLHPHSYVHNLHCSPQDHQPFDRVGSSSVPDSGSFPSLSLPLLLTHPLSNNLSFVIPSSTPTSPLPPTSPLSSTLSKVSPTRIRLAVVRRSRRKGRRLM